MQKWYAGTGRPTGRDPYFLYAASNLGSFLVLIAYPVIIEPYLGLRTQGWLWVVSYAAAVGMMLACLVLIRRNTPETITALSDLTVLDELPRPENKLDERVAVDFSPTRAGPRGDLMASHAVPPTLSAEPALLAIQRLGWVARAFVPSFLMIALTTHYTTDIAPAPLLWIPPLAVYLFTFVVAFGATVVASPGLCPDFPGTTAAGDCSGATGSVWHEAGAGRTLVLPAGDTFYRGHGLSWRVSPNGPSLHHLSEFYLWIALGGALGGICNAIVAPLVFDRVVEYPLVLVLAGLALPLSSDQPARRAWIPITLLAGLLVLTSPILYLSRTIDWFSQYRLSEPYSRADLWCFWAFVGLSAVAAVAVSTLSGKDRIERFLDYLMAVALALWTAALFRSIPLKGLGVLLAINGLAFVAIMTRIVFLALGKRLLGAFILVWPLLMTMGMELMMLVRASDNEMSFDVRGLAGQSFVLIGLPLILAATALDRPIRFGLARAAVMLARAAFGVEDRDDLVHRERTFFGVHRVENRGPGPVHSLLNGNTLHGQQNIDPENRQIPISYYHSTSPVGEALTGLQKRYPTAPIGVIGLGVGTLAAYGQPGQEMTFYEIDPAVIRIAGNPDWFTYLKDAKERGVRLKVVPGDGRLQIAHAPDGHFALIVVDGFSSGALPTHMLTREAIALYLRKLAPGGVIAIHISNRYLELQPMLSNLAAASGLVAKARYDSDEGVPGKSSSDWLLLARNNGDWRGLLTNPDWQNLSGNPEGLIWTDDFCNLLGVVRWRR